MNRVYNYMKHLIPMQNYIKKRENDNFLIIMSEKLEIQYLNEVAKDFYLLLDGKKNIENIVDNLLEIYDVSKEILEKDIFHLIRELQWKNLIILKEEEL